jgi:hypothetical protein
MATVAVTIEKVRAVTAPGYPPCFEYYVYLGDKLIRAASTGTGAKPNRCQHDPQTYGGKWTPRVGRSGCAVGLSSFGSSRRWRLAGSRFDP